MLKRTLKWIVFSVFLCSIYIGFLSSSIYRYPKTDFETTENKVGSFDLRIIILVLDRPRSLLRILDSVNNAFFYNDSVKLEVRIDRSKTKYLDLDTLRVAKNFVFKHGIYEIITNQHHIGIIGQWLTSWVPYSTTKEIAVILEDDMTLSKYFYKYLKLVHGKYDNTTIINGYALQGRSTTHNMTNRSTLQGPNDTYVFLYPVLGTWGFSPNNRNWRAFLDWYNSQKVKTGRRLYIPGNIASRWYKMLSRHGRGHTMWEIWHIYYAWKNNEYTLYSNFADHNGLTKHWAEKGLHSKHSGKGSNLLLTEWKQTYEELPNDPPKVDLSANVIHESSINNQT